MSAKRQRLTGHLLLQVSPLGEGVTVGVA